MTSNFEILENLLRAKEQEVLLINERILECRRRLQDLRNGTTGGRMRVKREVSTTNETRQAEAATATETCLLSVIEDVPRDKTEHLVTIGNTSKFLGGDKRHQFKWLVYVQVDDALEKRLEKVRFCLDPSYRPNDLVDVLKSPFRISRTGWGTFTIRVILFFTTPGGRTRTVQIYHNLHLDSTFQGRETAAAETSVKISFRGEEINVENATRKMIKDDVDETNTGEGFVDGVVLKQLVDKVPELNPTHRELEAMSPWNRFTIEWWHAKVIKQLLANNFPRHTPIGTKAIVLLLREIRE